MDDFLRVTANLTLPQALLLVGLIFAAVWWMKSE